MGGLRHAAAAALAAAMIWSWAGGAAAVETATVAKTGDTAPGTDGATFNSFGSTTSVNGAGQVAFRGVLTIAGGVTAPNDGGIWIGRPGSLFLVAREGDPAPGAGGAVFDQLAFPILNAAGEVAFAATVIGGGASASDNQGIWVGGPDSLQLRIREGQLVDGAVTFGCSSFCTEPFSNEIALNGSGEMTFPAFLVGGGVTSSNDRSTWLSTPGSLNLVAREGQLAPGTSELFSSINAPNLNGAGEVAFGASLANGDRGIWFGKPGSLSLVAKTGDPAPGTATTFDFVVFAGGLNHAGELAFRSSLTGGGSGIWAGLPGSPELFVQTGDRAPGTPDGVTFSGGGLFPLLNGAGEIGFIGSLTGTSVNSSNRDGVWIGRRGSQVLVARQGEQAPGTPPGVIFSDDGENCSDAFDDISINAAGEVVFEGCLEGGGVDGDNELGLWAGGPGGLSLIARTGDTIEVAPFDPRTVSEDGLNLFFRTGNEDGDGSHFSEGGQLAFRARFEGGSQGIFLSPPEAPSVHLLSHRVIDSDWDRIDLPQDFAKPVVIAGTPSFENKAPGVVRLRQLKGSSFQAKFQEWKHLNGGHPEETLDFIVLEKGRQRMADGSIWEAGTLKVSGNGVWKLKSFTKRFPGTPKLFLTIQGIRDRTPVAARARKVSRSGFEAALFEEEKLFGGNHRKEKVGYLAVYSKTNGGTITGGVNGTDYALKRPRVKHKFKTVLGQQIKLEEEKSQDKERRHKKERVAAMSLGRGFFAQQITDKETDTTAIRRRPPP